MHDQQSPQVSKAPSLSCRAKLVAASVIVFVSAVIGLGIGLAGPAYADDPVIICSGNGTTTQVLLHPGCPTVQATTPPTVAPPPPRTATSADVKGFTDGLEFYALAICIAAICVSGALWAIGSKGQNPGQELTGKRGLIVAVVAAFLIGSIPATMHYLTAQANQAHTAGVAAGGGSAGGGGTGGSSAGGGAQTIPTAPGGRCTTRDIHDGVGGC